MTRIPWRVRPSLLTKSKPAGLGLPLLITALVCAATTAAAAWLLRVFDLSNIVMLFLVAVVFIALKLGRVAGAFASVLCVASFDFFFVEPRFSFVVSDTQYLFTFALMLIVSLVIGQLAARLSSQAQNATAGEQRASALARIAADLAAAMDADQIAAICRNSIAPMFSARVSLLLPDANGVFPSPQNEAGTGALSFPLTASEGIRGVLVLQPETGAVANDPEDRRLLLACCSSIAMALERTHFVTLAQKAEMRVAGERLRNALLASVSHDLKTPLTVIRGLAETLEQPDRLSDGDQRDLAGSIRQQAEELQRSVANILDLARMQSDGMRLNSEWHFLSEVIGNAVATQRGRKVRIDVPHDLPLIEIDAVMVQRVLVNLLDNAAKYAKAGGTIRLRAAQGDGMMSLVLEDDGPGLPPGDPEDLFIPFWRGRAESSIPGVGLGLALCRIIIEAHRGTIRAVPSALGGAAFEIRLPLGQPPVIPRDED